MKKTTIGKRIFMEIEICTLYLRQTVELWTGIGDNKTEVIEIVQQISASVS